MIARLSILHKAEFLVRDMLGLIRVRLENLDPSDLGESSWAQVQDAQQTTLGSDAFIGRSEETAAQQDLRHHLHSSCYAS